MNATLHRLWAAVDEADRRLNLIYFQFHGDPIPPFEVLAKSTQEANVESPTADSSVYEDIRGQTITLKVEESAVLRQFWHSEIHLTAPSVHIEDAHNCVFYVRSSGPIFVHKMTNCVLIAASHQLRLHNMENCSVFADIGSGRAVIEHCDKITFGGFDRNTNTLTANKFDVDDFNWPTRATASPHYSMVESGYYWRLPNGERWGSKVWEHVRGAAWSKG